MAVKKVQSSYYTVADVDRARRFYESVLDLKIKFQDGQRWVQFDASGANFALSSKDESAGSVPGATVVFEVDDIDETRRQIFANGGEILAERDMGDHGRILTFSDLDGNIVQLFERRSK